MKSIRQRLLEALSETIVMLLCHTMTDLFYRTPYWIVSGSVGRRRRAPVGRLEGPEKPKRLLWKDLEGFSCAECGTGWVNTVIRWDQARLHCRLLCCSLVNKQGCVL